MKQDYPCRCVDIEMGYHSHAAYAVFLRFLEGLGQTHKLFMVNIQNAKIVQK